MPKTHGGAPLRPRPAVSSPDIVRSTLLILLLTSLIGAAPASADPPDSAPSSPAAAGELTPSDTPDPGLVPLTSDLIYALLVAELATQRDDQQTAFRHYLYAARLSGEPDMAGLAARAALSMNDPEAAVRATRIWSTLAPDSAKARQIAAYAYLDAGDRSAALAALADLIRLSENPGHGYMQAAQMLSRVQQPNERLAMMEELVAGQADSADAQFALAMLAGGANDLAAARRFTERAIALRADWNAPKLFLIRLLAASDRLDEAVGVLDGYLAEDPGDAELQLLRVQLHISAEEYEQALSHLDQIFSDGPPQPDLLMTAAAVALEIEAIDRARGYLLTLRETGARTDEAAFLLGQVEEMAGDADAALDWFREVRGENELEALLRIAGIHADRGEIARAREILQQLRDQHPDEAAALYLIEGELLRERDLQDEAIAVYNEGLNAAPDQPDLLYARAMLAVGMDRLDLLE
ncbi:MAG: tetratricopeptide repeat protein, partial [Thiohalocapsa sp.]